MQIGPREGVQVVDAVIRRLISCEREHFVPGFWMEISRQDTADTKAHHVRRDWLLKCLLYGFSVLLCTLHCSSLSFLYTQIPSPGDSDAGGLGSNILPRL